MVVDSSDTVLVLVGDVPNYQAELEDEGDSDASTRASTCYRCPQLRKRCAGLDNPKTESKDLLSELSDSNSDDGGVLLNGDCNKLLKKRVLKKNSDAKTLAKGKGKAKAITQSSRSG